jgi:hypothetical protein
LRLSAAASDAAGPDMMTLYFLRRRHLFKQPYIRPSCQVFVPSALILFNATLRSPAVDLDFANLPATRRPWLDVAADLDSPTQ